jgi:hypothetical protein
MTKLVVLMAFILCAVFCGSTTLTPSPAAAAPSCGKCAD